MARDIRTNWSLVDYGLNTSVEYHRLKVEMERQEKNTNPQTDPKNVLTFEQFWDEEIPDVGKSMGDVLVTSSCVSEQWPEFLKKLLSERDTAA